MLTNCVVTLILMVSQSTNWCRLTFPCTTLRQASKQNFIFVFFFALNHSYRSSIFGCGNSHLTGTEETIPPLCCCILSSSFIIFHPFLAEILLPPASLTSLLPGEPLNHWTMGQNVPLRHTHRKKKNLPLPPAQITIRGSSVAPSWKLCHTEEVKETSKF